LNVWFDHGTGNGGNIIDFGINYHKCSVSEFLDRLAGVGGRPALSMFRVLPSPDIAGSKAAADEKKDDTAGRISVVNVHPLSEMALLQYLGQRHIRVEVARQFCHEVEFRYTRKGIRQSVSEQFRRL
jgi:hypothetical protein